MFKVFEKQNWAAFPRSLLHAMSFVSYTLRCTLDVDLRRLRGNGAMICLGSVDSAISCMTWLIRTFCVSSGNLWTLTSRFYIRPKNIPSVGIFASELVYSEGHLVIRWVWTVTGKLSKDWTDKMLT